MSVTYHVSSARCRHHCANARLHVRKLPLQPRTPVGPNGRCDSRQSPSTITTTFGTFATISGRNILQDIESDHGAHYDNPLAVCTKTCKQKITITMYGARGSHLRDQENRKRLRTYVYALNLMTQALDWAPTSSTEPGADTHTVCTDLRQRWHAQPIHQNVRHAQ